MMKFRHYKGGIYTYLMTGKHSETEEEMVVYTNANDEVWIRPADMFFGNVIVDGKELRRFEKVDEKDQA